MLTRILVLLLTISPVAFSQSFGLGIKGGALASDFLDAAGDTISQPGFSKVRYLTKDRRLIFGPMAELRLPGRVGVEADLLIKSLEFRTEAIEPVEASVKTTARSVEIPILLKYRFSDNLLRPFLGAGFSYRHLFDEKTEILSGVGLPAPTLEDQSGKGIVLAAGLELQFVLVRAAGEFRYTRWGTSSYLNTLGSVATNANQVEFLVSFGF